MAEIEERFLDLAEITDEQFASLLVDVSDELVSRAAQAEPNGGRYWTAAGFIDLATEELRQIREAP